MSDRPVIVWFRLDLRVADNPALSAAETTGAPVIPVYVLDETVRDGPLGGAGRWWLHHSLESLGRRLEKMGVRLLLLRGKGREVVSELAERVDARAVYWNRRYEPDAIERDKRVKATLDRAGVEARSFNASLLYEPWTVSTRTGEFYKVFTPFWKACLSRAGPDRPTSPPSRLNRPKALPDGDKLDQWNLLPKAPGWSSGFGEHWMPGEAGASHMLDRFLNERLRDYGRTRDRPARGGTSRLSPHLHWGEIGPRQIWHAVHARAQFEQASTPDGSAGKFLAELGWREFSYHLLYHFPGLPERNFRPAFESFPWRGDDESLDLWCRGRTGFPIVDAGMRELWATGWMHNRARMIAASFLVKDLLVDWRRGMRWFEDTLVDADLASNAASWQWVAGSGADAAPYFRIFNPVLQGEKFDPDGDYVRRWVPELAKLPARWTHSPWRAPEDVVAGAGIRLGKDYPLPCVDHSEARREALAAFETIKAA